jgi:hypothetical protein
LNPGWTAILYFFVPRIAFRRLLTLFPLSFPIKHCIFELGFSGKVTGTMQFENVADIGDLDDLLEDLEDDYDAM